MHYLALSIISSTLIIVSFKLTGLYHIRIFHAIVINYLFAGLLGLAITLSKGFSPGIWGKEWFILALVIGTLFVLMFYLIGLTTSKSGLSVTAVSTRISVVLPILFSIFFYREAVGYVKVSGIITALVALVFVSIRREGRKTEALKTGLPFFLFIGTGITDTLVKYAQQEYLKTDNLVPFATFLFFTALFVSTVVLLSNRHTLRGFFTAPTILAGAFLGIFNFSSLYFFIKALGHAPVDSSVVFGLNHLGIILLGSFTGFLFFREKISILNFLGIVLSCTAIVMLYYS